MADRSSGYGVSTRPFSLYLIRCADGSLYTGITVDVARRLRQHRSGASGAKYLRGRGPLQVVFSEVVGDRSEASRLEHRVKRLDRGDKEALVAGRLAIEELLENRGQASGGSGPNSSVGSPNTGQ